MKRIHRIFLLLLLMVAGITTLSAQSSKERKQQKAKAVKEQIAAKDYKIGVSNAYPMSGRMVNLTSLYSLEVKNDSVYSYLPYYGRAYSVPYGGGQGLIFSAPIEKYELEYKKKGEARITLESRTPEDTYKYYITVYSDGTASISVNMQNRESINYSGEMVVKEEAKEK